MKKLQNNFTTPEQSKRLLELGVPADSADCYINLWNNYPYGILAEDESYSNYKFAGYMNDSKVLPCWSVGRLIEIHRICSTLPDEEYMFPFWKDIEDNVEWAIRVLESGIRIGNMDFSKLEE